MKKLILLPLLLVLAGCPGKGREGAESGERQSIHIDGNYVCFTVNPADVLTRYTLSTNDEKYRLLLVGESKYLFYPDTCFTVNLERGVVYGVSYTLNKKNYFYGFILDRNGRVLDLGRS